MCPRLGRTTPGDYRRPERPGPAPVGLVCRGRLGPQSPSGSADLPPPPGAQTGPGDSRAPAAQPLARAVSPMLTRQGSCAREQCCPPAGRGADAPDAALDHHGRPRTEALAPAACLASANARTPRGPHPLRPGPLLGPPLARLLPAALGAHGLRGRRRPRAWRSLDTAEALRPTCAEDGRRAQRPFSGAARAQTRRGTRRPAGESAARRVGGRHTGSAPSSGNPVSTRHRLLTTPGAPRRKKEQHRA